MPQRNNEVTLKGNPVTLEGDPVKVGDKAPDFSLVGNDMKPKSLGDFAGKVKILSIVPSLDTSVCDTETRRFNEEASSLGDDVQVITVSVDTPMAQKRWCAAAGVDRVTCLSDFKDHRFGRDYGVRMHEPGLLARQVMVLDRHDTVKYVQLVNEVADEPDYDKAIAAAKELV